MVGFPNEKATMSTIRGLVKGGADIIELGFPFSDPLADGPVIQNASTISLEKGTNVSKFFNIVKKIRKETDIPLVLMTYTNILHRMGYQKFIKNAKKVGIDGFILPDMSIEESKDYLKAAKNNSDTIFLISPNTSKTRIEKIDESINRIFVSCCSIWNYRCKNRYQKLYIKSNQKCKKTNQR
jgi:tryptophan synthase, alpha subunit